jgi:hypothetical protein
MKKYFIVLAALALVGCEDPVTDSKIDTGVWTSDCHGGMTAQGQIDSIMFSDGRYSMTTTTFSDPRCEQAVMNVYENGSYTTSNGINKYTNIDMQLGDVTILPVTDDMANNMNASAYCGLTGWNTSVAMSVAGRTCSGRRIRSFGALSYDIYFIPTEDGMGLKQGNLYFGRKDGNYDGSAMNRRPVSLNYWMFTKH